MRWAVLLAGGSGTRFWPLSTPRTPKQLLPLSGSGSTAEEAVERLTGLIPRERVLVVAGEALAARLRPLLNLPAENFLVEPRAASTAPALIWATWEAQRRDPDAEVLSLHADWAVGDARGLPQHRRRRARPPPGRTTGWSPSAWCRRGPRPATATSCPARRSTTAPAPWRGSPRSPTRPPRSI